MLVIKQTAGIKKSNTPDKSVNEDRIVTLRIKRRFLEEIASGAKQVEFREHNAYYQSLFLRPFNRLKLHFQTSRQIIVEVTRVKTQEDFFAIELGRIVSSVQ